MAAQNARQLDTSQLAERTRLYVLAKEWGMSSKELVGHFANLGTRKVASSTVTKDEAQQLADALSQEPQAAGGAGAEAVEATAAKAAKGEKPKKKTTKKTAKKTAKKKEKKEEPEQKSEVNPELIRANVDNEIRQIARKVDAELVAAAAEEVEEKAPETPKKRTRKRAVKRPSPAVPATKPAKEATEASTVGKEESNADVNVEALRANVDNEIQQITDKVDAELVELLSSDLAADVDDADEELAPVLPPVPDVESDVYGFAPVFIPPVTSDPLTSDVEDAVENGQDAAVGEASSGEGVDDDVKKAGDAQATRKRRGRRGTSRGRGSRDSADRAGGDESAKDSGDDTPELIDEPKAIKGSTRMEAKRRRRAEMRELGIERSHIVSQAEFLARRESVERTMVVRERQREDHPGLVTQVGVLEDGMLVEHFVTSETQSSIIGNIYLGRVQNVLPSMEAAFIDIGTGRNGVLYAGEVDWRAVGAGRSRRIEQALKSGDQVLVQVSKDPIGHKGARLTTQVSLAGRYLVYVPNGHSAGISRKLPVPERKRLREILDRVVPGKGGAIIRTAAENVPEEAIAADVNRLHAVWEDIAARAEKEKSSKGAKPVAMYEEPDMLVKVVRDLFNEDFSQLIVDGRKAFNTVDAYINSVAPDLADRVVKFDRKQHGGEDAFEKFRVDEQLHKALSRKVWLPSGGTLVIDRTEAMTVVDVNTGKFTGSGGNLEETVTLNNLEAAEEIVRQMRLRDLGGMIVVDFIDMVLPENQELVLRRLKEALGRDRTRHQVSEVTSLGLVQMTRKRLGTGLLETFSTECEHCGGRGIILHDDPVEESDDDAPRKRPQRTSARTERPAAQAASPESETPDTSLEDLVASVVVDREREDDDHKPAKRGGRRRGRRRNGSAASDTSVSVNESHDSRAARGSENAVSDIESIAYTAAENAAEADDVAEFNAYVPDESHDGGHGFDEAMAEYEASPRRKRRTRGNSRSDYPPKREDFAPAADDAAPEAPGTAAKADRGERKAAGDERQPATAMANSKAAKRGRRRVVRRLAPEPVAEPAAGNASEGTSKQAPQRAEAPERDSGQNAGGEPKSASSRRGRKRAVRKSLTKAASGVGSGTATEAKKSAAETKKPASGAKAGRGRRRVARRTAR